MTGRWSSALCVGLSRGQGFLTFGSSISSSASLCYLPQHKKKMTGDWRASETEIKCTCVYLSVCFMCVCAGCVGLPTWVQHFRIDLKNSALLLIMQKAKRTVDTAQEKTPYFIFDERKSGGGCWLFYYMQMEEEMLQCSPSQDFSSCISEHWGFISVISIFKSFPAFSNHSFTYETFEFKGCIWIYIWRRCKQH